MWKMCKYFIKGKGFRVQFLAGAGNFSLHHCVQDTSGAHPASYPMGTGVERLVHEADQLTSI